MATATHSTKPVIFDSHKLKEKGNRRPEGPLNLHHVPSNTTSSGSIPKRYQSVFLEGTPLTSFGVHHDENQLRSHSPPNHIQPQLHQRSLKPVKEFLAPQSKIDQQIDDRWPSNSQTNTQQRSQTETTVQNVNAAVSKSLKKLRQGPERTPTTNGRSTSFENGSIPPRSMTVRTSSYSNNDTTATSNLYYQLPGGTRGPLPVQLITKRPSTLRVPNHLSNGISHNRVSSEINPINVQQQPTISTHHVQRSIDATNIHVSSSLRASTKEIDGDVHHTDGFNFNGVTVDERLDRLRKSKNESNPQLTGRSTSQKQTPAPRAPSADNQHRALPEVSVNPHIQSSVQRNGEQFPHKQESTPNGTSDDQNRPQTQENYSISNLNTAEKYTSHHHIQVEPISTYKRPSSPVKHQQIVDIQPNIIVQHQRTASKLDSETHLRVSSTKQAVNEIYGERDNIPVQLLNLESIHGNNETDSGSTLKQYVNQYQDDRSQSISPATEELNRIWKHRRNKFSMRSPTATLVVRKTMRTYRPSGRLKHYEDESDSETTATETQSRDKDMEQRHGLPASDLGSDVWSDLTSEFSDTKLRRHPNIRTSTPNMTARSSSLSSKEIGQIRKQLTDLQTMYNDLLKLLDVDGESVKGSRKSSTSSQIDHNNRRHRFRKIMPATSIRQSNVPNVDIGEVNQRFTRLEASVVTLAESIAKLSAQIQTQRVIKEDVYHLRQEIGELRQELNYLHSRQQSTIPGNTTSSIPVAVQHPSRLITTNVQRLGAVNNTNGSNFSTSYVPSISTMQRSTSIIDPRQARKIEQFFGTEAMLRYFLSLLHYEQYAPLLEQEKIGIYELPYISEKKLQSLGIPFGPCARIVYEAQQYFISLLTLKSSGIEV